LKAPSPVTFDPSNEPYLGRESVYVLDNLIPVVLESWAKIERELPGRGLTLLQAASVDIFPSTLSIGLSIRELVRQGYLYGAVVLIRPLMERALTHQYLVTEPSALSIWSQGWDYSKRPKMNEMLAKIDQSNILNGLNPFKHLNEHIHADPKGSVKLTRSTDSNVKYVVSKDLVNPHECDELCMYAAAALSMVMVNSLSAFFSEGQETC
jgi:hypothetical protein